MVRSAGDVRQIDLLAPAASLLTVLAPGVIDEYPAHGLGGGGEEVAAAVKLNPRQAGGYMADEPKVRFMDQRGGVEGVTRSLLGHACGGELPQLVVNEREQVGGSSAVAGPSGFEKASHVRHDSRVYWFLVAGVGS